MTDKTKKILKITGLSLLGLVGLGIILVIISNIGFSTVKHEFPGVRSDFAYESKISDSTSFSLSRPRQKSINSAALTVQSESAVDYDFAQVDKKIIKTGDLDLYVKNIDESIEKIKQTTESFGGYVVNSNVRNNRSGHKYANITVKVPSKNFEKIINNVKQIATEVENERISGEDVTEEYIDLEAQIKNLKTEEESYARIMGNAVTIEETLNVSHRLSDVRGRIERAEGRFKYLSRQVEMSTIAITLSTDADIEVFGIRWRPLTVAKKAVRNMLEGLANYTDTMINFLVMLPVIVLWIGTITIGLIIVFKFLKWVYRKTFKHHE